MKGLETELFLWGLAEVMLMAQILMDCIFGKIMTVGEDDIIEK